MLSDNEWGVNIERIQELIQPDPRQVLNIKGKDEKIQVNSHKKNRWQAEFAALFEKGGSSVILALYSSKIDIFFI